MKKLFLMMLMAVTLGVTAQSRTDVFPNRLRFANVPQFNPTATTGGVRFLTIDKNGNVVWKIPDGVSADLSKYATLDTLTNEIATRAPIDSPAFTGTITADGEVYFPESTYIGTVDNNEIFALEGIQSNIQQQFTRLNNTKAPIDSPTFTGTVVLPSTTSIANVSSTELAHLDGVTSGIQAQLTAKSSSFSSSASLAELLSDESGSGKVAYTQDPIFTNTVTLPAGTTVGAVVTYNNPVSVSASLPGTYNNVIITGTTGTSIIFPSSSSSLGKVLYIINTGSTTVTVSFTGSDVRSLGVDGSNISLTSLRGVICVPGPDTRWYYTPL